MLKGWMAKAKSRLRALPTTGAVTGILEALAFFQDPAFAQRRFNVLEMFLKHQ